MQISHVAVLAAAAFAVLSWFNANMGAGAIESDLRARAQREIAAVLGSADEVRVEADGRDLTLTGTVASEIARAATESRVRGLWGVRTVSNRVDVVDIDETVEPETLSALLAAAPYRLTISLNSTDTVLDGLVRDEPTRAALLAVAASREVGGNVRSTLEVEPDVHPQWSEATLEIMRAVVALRDVEAHFADYQISVGGRASSPEERDRALAAIRSAVPYGVVLQTELTAPLSAAAARCEQRFAELQTRRPAIFLSTGTALLPSGHELLDALAVTLQQCPDTSIEVAGYSESTHDYGAALRISQARADVITAQLIARGIDGGRLSAIGYGTVEATRADSASDDRVPGQQLALLVRER